MVTETTTLTPTDRPARLFSTFCEVLERIGRERSTSRKASLFAQYVMRLRHENGSRELALACRFAGEGAFDQRGGTRVGIGARSVAMAASEFCGIDYDHVFKPCRTATGSGSEAIELLMSNLDSVRSRQTSTGLTLLQMESGFQDLNSMRGTAERQALLQQLWLDMSPREVKFMIRIMGQGSLRIGFETRSILNALAQAFQKDPEEVRHAHMVTGSLSETAELLATGRLEQAEFRLFRPLAFMLASPLHLSSEGPGSEESLDFLDLAEYLVEEKFDGIRCQLHLDGDRVELYSRDLNTISPTFPDLTVSMGALGIPGAVLDGEIVAFKEGRILPFQSLQRRLGVKTPTRALLEEIPVHFIAYDLLYLDGEEFLKTPLEKRRESLRRLCAIHGLALSRSFTVSGLQELHEAFQRAQAGGNEGLMLKKHDSTYEFGQRRRSWLKMKQPEGSLTTVVLYAHAGSGRRGGLYSDFTLGVSVRDDDRYEEDFIPIGKAYGGYTDQELRQINRRLKELTLERFGPTLLLRPELVVELEFDAIQMNRRTKAGYTLRFPRFKAIRWDLSPWDADTLTEVERRIRQREEREIRPLDDSPSFQIPD